MNYGDKSFRRWTTRRNPVLPETKGVRRASTLGNFTPGLMESPVTRGSLTRSMGPSESYHTQTPVRRPSVSTERPVRVPEGPVCGSIPGTCVCGKGVKGGTTNPCH